MSVRPQLIENGRDSRRVSEAQAIRVGLYEKMKLEGTESRDCYPEPRRITLPRTSVHKGEKRAGVFA